MENEVIGIPQFLKTRVLYELPFFECEKDDFELREIKKPKKFDVKEKLKKLFLELKNE